jgi:YesN/AraC family two-component response regulator
MLNKILLVDDDSEFRKEFEHCFGEYDIVHAPTGEEALAILRKPNEIGLVILDVNMPGMGGTDVLACMKAISPELSVVIVTGFSSKDVAINALKRRADDYIEKPFEMEEMREVMERLLGDGRRGKGRNGSGAAADRIRRVKDYVERNCYRKITLNDAARAVSLCPKYLSRVFKEAAGEAFSAYRIKVQMKKACELLASGRYNVNQVSEKLGYRNPESFIRQFKRFTRRTPSQYRKKKATRS